MQFTREREKNNKSSEWRCLISEKAAIKANLLSRCSHCAIFQENLMHAGLFRNILRSLFLSSAIGLIYYNYPFLNCQQSVNVLNNDGGALTRTVPTLDAYKLPFKGIGAPAGFFWHRIRVIIIMGVCYVSSVA